MYNKIFTKILDSSIWLEPTPTRILWMTLLAAMDETGFAAFAGIANLSHRARLSLDDTTAAVNTLESPDADSSDPDHEGRRIERVPGGWIVLNAEKYREMVTREVAKEKNRRCVARFRAKKLNAPVMVCNDSVRPCHVSVSPSEAEASAGSETETEAVTSTLSVTLPVKGTPPKAKTKAVEQSDEEWMDGLRANPAYAGIVIAVEYGKMAAWCETRKLTPTRRRFINWLNRAEKPMSARTADPTKSRFGW